MGARKDFQWKIQKLKRNTDFGKISETKPRVKEDLSEEKQSAKADLEIRKDFQKKVKEFERETGDLRNKPGIGRIPT